jgi:hypothetical protein
MTAAELQRFVFEAQNIVDGYTYSLPSGVSIDCAEDVDLGLRPSVQEHDDSVSVLAWVTIPKDYFIANNLD